MAQDIVAFRTGQFSSIFLTLHSSSLSVIKRALSKKIKSSPSIFQHIAVILQFTPELEKVNLQALKSLCEEFNIHIIGVSGLDKSSAKRINHDIRLSLVG